MSPHRCSDDLGALAFQGMTVQFFTLGGRQTTHKTKVSYAPFEAGHSWHWPYLCSLKSWIQQ